MQRGKNHAGKSRSPCLEICSEFLGFQHKSSSLVYLKLECLCNRLIRM